MRKKRPYSDLGRHLLARDLPLAEVSPLPRRIARPSAGCDRRGRVCRAFPIRCRSIGRSPARQQPSSGAGGHAAIPPPHVHGAAPHCVIHCRAVCGTLVCLGSHGLFHHVCSVPGDDESRARMFYFGPIGRRRWSPCFSHWPCPALLLWPFTVPHAAAFLPCLTGGSGRCCWLQQRHGCGCTLRSLTPATTANLPWEATLLTFCSAWCP